jgi:MFS superfamily sulfate permease-like transporter
MLSAIFVDRPRLAVVIAIVTSIAGALALFTIPVAQYPDIVPPQVSVTTTYPGASAAVVESTVAQPIESQVVGVDKMIYMKSVSGNDGSYTLTGSFELGTDPDINAVNVNNRVQIALAKLPEDVRKQGVTVKKKSSALLGVLGIALMSFTESIAAGRAFAAPGDPPIDANRELVATGAANLGGALLGSMPAGGGTSQTGVVRSAGGRTQVASFVTAAAALATMLLLAPVLGLLPQATLAAIVIVYSASLIQPAEFRAIYQVRRMEFRWAVVAALGVLVFGTLQGIVVAIVLSLLGLALQTAHPRVSIIARKRGADVLRPLSSEHPDDETFEGLLILRPEGRLYFANAQNVADRIRALVDEHKPRVVVLDFSRVPDIEYSALQMLQEAVRRSSITFWLVGLNPGVLDMVRRAGLDQELGVDRLMFNTRTAIERYKAASHRPTVPDAISG